MGIRIPVLLMLAFIQSTSVIAAQPSNFDLSILNALKDAWKWDNMPPSWSSLDPCGSKWEGIGCNNSRVTSITLSSMGLKGSLTGDISSLSELQILDLSYNPDLRGPLPPSIGNLKKLTSLILVGCSFSGSIPDSIGSLRQLVYLSLNSNNFSGEIPPSIGNLSNLFWLDIADNQLEGTIPVSSGTKPGLDMLFNAKHFHMGKNRLSGEIPAQLFSSNMTLIHLLLDNNELIGNIPSTLGLVQTLELVRFDRNQLNGSIPSNLSNLTNVTHLILSNAGLTGSIPNVSSMVNLTYLDISNNSFDASDFPLWLSNSQALTTIMMEQIQLQGEIPPELFCLPKLNTVVLKNNQLNDTLDIGTSYSAQLQLIDLQNNLISRYIPSAGNKVNIILAGNPICQERATESYCFTSLTNSSYTTPSNNCVRSVCASNQISSPNCQCSYPYTGILFFRAPIFSGLGNSTDYASLEKFLMDSFMSIQLPVDSVSLRNPRFEFGYFVVNLEVFPFEQEHFNRTAISGIGTVLSSKFGPFYFIPGGHDYFLETGSNKSLSTNIIIGATAGGIILLLLFLLAGIYVYRSKRATVQSNHSAHCDSTKRHIGVPHVTALRCFSFEELKKSTCNFAEANEIGFGGYGKVYRGTLPTGQLIAIKRAKMESKQGVLEFKTEIELLSRVHHRNLVSLVGYCFEHGEEMLIYEFIPNGNLRDSLSGKSGIKLEWMRRVKVALDTARGLAYLHELANPPIIHRDIKSKNILLDEHLNAKVCDFGISKPISECSEGHLTTQVKGTMGYLDPEYFMTQQLTEKSDVYSFGVLMLEMVTGRKPLERGKYIVNEVAVVMDKTKDLCNLHELLDPSIGLENTLRGLEKFADLAVKCVQETRVDRPTMGEVVTEIENILHLLEINPNIDSAYASAGYEETSDEDHPYYKEGFDSSGAITPNIYTYIMENKGVDNLQWKAPPTNVYKLNTDASLRGGRTGLGVIIRDHNGQIMLTGVKNVAANYEADIAEGMAILFGLSLAVDSNLGPLIVESDCLEIIQALTTDDPKDKYLEIVADDVKALLPVIDVVSFRHIREEANRAAHELALFSFTIDNYGVWIEQTPPGFHFDVSVDVNVPIS